MTKSTSERKLYAVEPSEELPNTFRLTFFLVKHVNKHFGHSHLSILSFIIFVVTPISSRILQTSDSSHEGGVATHATIKAI